MTFPVLMFLLEAVALYTFLRVRIGATYVFRWELVAIAVFFCCGVLKHREAFRRFASVAGQTAVDWVRLTFHFLALLPLAGATWALQRTNPEPIASALLIVLWYSSLVVAMTCGVLALLRWPDIRDLLQATGRLWLYAVLTGVATTWVVAKAGTTLIDATVWRSGVRMTFFLVEGLVRPFVANVASEPAAARIWTERFGVRIDIGCTGIEGVTLILAFSAAWIWFFRSELRFPRSLLLIPASVVLTFLLNSVRIAALLLIGHLGAPNVAIGGFHSNAGWIFFICVAAGLVYATQTRWLRHGAVAGPVAPGSPPLGEADGTAAYLTPLLAITVVAMLTRAASAGFDGLYPLRFVAACAVLWTFRGAYRLLDWRFSPMSAAVGAAVFAMWIALAGSGGDGGKALANGLQGLPAWARALWLIFRVLGATLTVPVAEELAFRGYGIRRLQSANFESIDWRSYTWPSLLISSLAFGWMHGDRWIAGTLAGLAYAFAMLRRGRIGDAVAAHATTNALLALWVIRRGAWELW